MLRSLLVWAILTVLVGVGSAQTTPVAASNLTLDAGVAAHKGLDEVYRQFGGLYTESAAYLAPGQPLQTGRQSINGTFKSFFDSNRARNWKVEIAFRIVQREVDTKLAYDVGIYTLTIIDQNGGRQPVSGKFAVVAKLQPDNTWRFQVDAYNDLPPGR
jgi:ketosteroid isomerase-like protein